MKIIKKLDDHGLIRLMPAEESAKEYRSAIGGVRKDELRDRLIMIRMPENSREQCPQEFSKQLAHGTMLAEMQLRPNEVAEASVDDLRDFFHSFAITPERCATNALQGAYDGEVFRGWRCFEPGLSGQSVVCCLNTLAMGDGSAVEIAQASHLGLGRAVGLFARDELVVYGRPVPRGHVWDGLVIDDHAVFRIRDADADPNAHDRDLESMKRLGWAYRQVGLRVHGARASVGRSR